MLKYCSEAERKTTLLGISIGIGEVAGTLILTNLGFCNSLTYMVLGVMASLIPISCAFRKLLGEKKRVIFMSFFCALVVFANLFVCRAMTLFYMNIFEVRNVVKEGPAVGIFSSYMGPYISNTTMAEWKELVKPGDNVLIVVKGRGDTGTQSLEYLYEDVNICVMDTQTSVSFDERLLAYWELHPDKVPNVVVVDCWFGELHMDEESWIMQWIYEEFGRENYTDGTYRRYYRKEG